MLGYLHIDLEGVDKNCLSSMLAEAKKQKSR